MVYYFAKNVKHYRKELDLTQQELAKIIKVRRKTICDLENDHFNPRIETLVKLAQLFKISITNLILRNHDKPKDKKKANTATQTRKK